MTDAEFPDAVREVIRDEQMSISVCTFARVKSVTESSQRVAVELKNDPAWADGNIPLVSPQAGDGVGDVPGVTAGDEVLVLFSADDVAGMLAERGPTPDAGRDGVPQHAIALPFGAYTDPDTVPDHEPGERLLAHQNGTMIRLGGTDGADIRMTHPSGMEVAMDEAQDPYKGVPDPPDRNRDAPDETNGVIRMQHPSGVGVEVGDDGISITPGSTDGDSSSDDGGSHGYGYDGYNEGGYGEGGRQQGVFTHRRQNDPWRVEMAGDPDRPQEGHRHLIPRGDGTYSMTGPPMPMRTMFTWFCARYGELGNSTAPAMQDAQTFYEQWLAWLEAQTGESLDPSAGDDTGAEWPYPEPVPSPAERDSFHPD